MSIVLVMVLICAVLGALLSQSKGRPPWQGALLGLALGLIGLLIVAVLPKRAAA